MPVGLDGEGVANLVLDILREQTHAEVAMVNKRSIKTEFIRSADISQLDIMEALPYDNAVVVGRIPGSLLKGYLLGDAVNQRLRFRGLTTDGHGGVQVNGRPLQEDQTYVVVLNDFLARGGDHLITDPTLHFHTRGPATLRQGWTDWLRARTNPGDWAGHYPRDPARMVRWVVRTTADASLSQTRVANPDPTSFTDTQLTQVNAVSLHGDVELRADADHPDFTFENDLMGRYGTARTAASVGLNAPAVYSETDDLIFLRDVASQKRWAGLKSAPYVPLFFGESYLESEFTTPSTRTYHHLEWRPTGGIRFSLLPELSITGAVGFDWETLARDDQMPAHQPSLAAVVVGGIQLRPKQVLKLGPLQLNAEGTLDVEERNFGANRSSLIRFHAKVSLPIWKMLSLTLTYDLFARRYDPEYLMGTAAAANGWSFAGNALVGLAFSWVEPVQTFWF